MRMSMGRRLGLVTALAAVFLMALGLAVGRLDVTALDGDTLAKDTVESPAAKVFSLAVVVLLAHVLLLSGPRHPGWLEESREHSPAEFTAEVVSPRSPPSSVRHCCRRVFP